MTTRQARFAAIRTYLHSARTEIACLRKELPFEVGEYEEAMQADINDMIKWLDDEAKTRNWFCPRK